MLNGYKIKATQSEKEKIVLGIASGELNQEQFTNWLNSHTVER